MKIWNGRFSKGVEAAGLEMCSRGSRGTYIRRCENLGAFMRLELSDFLLQPSCCEARIRVACWERAVTFDVSMP